MNDEGAGCFVLVLLVVFMCLCLWIYEVESIKRRAIDNGHAIYHPDTGEFVFKGEFENEIE